jgi:MFS family permease
MATDALPDAFNSIVGLLFAAFALGAFIGPLLGSTLGNSSLAWLVLSLISSTGIVIIILRLRHENHSLRKDAEAIEQPIQV